MIDHVSIAVKNYKKSLRFYDETLSTLGYQRVMTIDIPEQKVEAAGYGTSKKPYFWIAPMGNPAEEIGRARGVHIAFVAPNVEAVHSWHTTCLQLGGTDNGVPGPRPEYHPGYYGAYIVDPDGWRIEAAFQQYQQ